MRQYLAPEDLDGRGLLAVSGKEYHYLRKVLRLKAGDMILLRLKDGSLRNSTVCSVDDGAGRVVIQPAAEAGQASDEAGIRWWLFQIAPQPKKMELIVRQAAECGASYVVPVSGEFSQKGSLDALNSGGEKNSRLERIIREARQQSGSPVETQVLPLCPLERAVEFWNGKTDPHKRLAVVLYEQDSGARELHSAARDSDGVLDAAIFCGCEGGISPSEIEFLSGSGFVPVHFKTNILRCETAALYGMAALQSALMEKSLWQ